jgi:hypothetical protein
MNEKQHKGMILFHSADPAMAQRGAMACSSCHPDNRADGLSWRIEKKELQTPVLAGRVVGTHPYKWDGGDKDLNTSLTMTMKRLGGFGLDKVQTANLSASSRYPSPRPPTRDVQTVARGRGLRFGRAAARAMTARPTRTAKHKFSGTLPRPTPRASSVCRRRLRTSTTVARRPSRRSSATVARCTAWVTRASSPTSRSPT